MKRLMLSTLSGIAVLSAASGAHATTYTSDPNLSDFLTGNGSYATLSNFSGGTASPYTPTDASISSGTRAYAGGSITGLPTNNNWILATFSNATADIRVFSNIDHFGSAYDGYQYTIEGSNDLTHWNFLFDATSVSSSGEPFTLLASNGTAPTTVNNVLSPSGGAVGYIADFDFGTAYNYYAFGASTVAFAQGNPDQELSAVSTIPGAVPEPSTWAMLLLGFAGIGFMAYRRSHKGAAFA